MRIEATKAETFTIFDAAPNLDPVTVTLQDWGHGSGRLVVECFGWAWGNYWGAMGNRDLRAFLIDCGADYVTTKLMNHQRRATKAEEKYLARIVAAVLDALRTGPAQSNINKETP